MAGLAPGAWYELQDFGGGRKLERFGPWVVDRPAPAAEQASAVLPRATWQTADARYDRAPGGGRWTTRPGLEETATVSAGPLRLLLRRTDSGQVGLFPEQAALWPRIAEQVARAAGPLQVLSLFAFTGGATLTAAAAGAAVTHVDAAASAVAWARENAALSGLADRPTRWICEDALRYVERELRRGRRYDALIVDPPSYGHGPRGEPWQVDRDLGPLLARCAELTAGAPRFVLLSCHSPGWGPAELSQQLRAAFGTRANAAARSLWLQTPDGRKLDCGAAVQLSAE